MKRIPVACLWDEQQACMAIRSFIRDADQERYLSDLMLRSAVERQMMNIGEALVQLSRLDPTLASKVPRHRQLIGFRNVLVHGYAGLNDAEVWSAVQLNLPGLLEAVDTLLQDPGAPPPA